MYNIATYNSISSEGLSCFSKDTFNIEQQRVDPDAILCRSQQITPEMLNPELKAIARAGAGVDKICVDTCTENGIPVFNTPGANANAVNELVLFSLILCSRNILDGIRFLKEAGLSKMAPDDASRYIEQGKKQFSGEELKAKTLGIVGMGAIGSKVANAAIALGMKVVGYDPQLTVDYALQIHHGIIRSNSLSEVLEQSNYLTLYLPMSASTKDLMDWSLVSSLKPGIKLVNFSRAGIINEEAVRKGLDENIISRFVTDFYYSMLFEHPNVMTIPHLGASTKEAENNCVTMAGKQLIEFLTSGNITNAVNFPNVFLGKNDGHRLAITITNQTSQLNAIIKMLTEFNIDMIQMNSQTSKTLTYTLIDTKQKIAAPMIKMIKALENIKFVRVLY